MMARWVKRLGNAIGGLGAMAVAVSANIAFAQDGALTELYGYAVHRYYAGDYNEAQRALALVIEAGVEDPRPHYFRGLVTYQLGMQDAAKADFENAAQMEARGKGVVSIGQALQRIQGPVRREIEMARLMARVAVAQEQRANKQAQAEQARTNPSLAQPPASAESLPPGLSNEMPAAAPPATVPATPPATTPDAVTDPFKDDAVPAPAAPAAPSTDPFSAPAAPDAAAPASPAAPAAPAADPFSAPAAPATPAAPAADDPFGGAAAPAAPATPEPAAPAAPATAPADPFQ